jgi:hypothetical protein
LLQEEEVRKVVSILVAKKIFIINMFADICLSLLSFSDKKVGSIVGDLEVIEALVQNLSIEVLCQLPCLFTCLL